MPPGRPIPRASTRGDKLPSGSAYAALTRATQVHAGDVVFVTSASGAIGSMAGQIARLLGAGHVVGATGSRAKADRLVRELGFDAAVVRGDGTLIDQLRDAAPDGIDVVLDNAGGDQLAAGVAAAREGGRIVVTGALSGQLAPSGSGRTAPVTLDSFQLLLGKLSLRGYSADDDPDARSEWTARFGPWLRDGRIVFPHERVDGLDAGPATLQRVAAGGSSGPWSSRSARQPDTPASSRTLASIDARAYKPRSWID